MQLIIFFELLVKCLQNRRNQFWRVCVQQRSLHFRVHPIFLPNFLCMLFKVALQRYFDSPTVCEETRRPPNIRTRFWSHLLNVPSAHTSLYEVSGWFVCEFPHRRFSPRCMSSWMFMQPITISKVLSHVALHHHTHFFEEHEHLIPRLVCLKKNTSGAMQIPQGFSTWDIHKFGHERSAETLQLNVLKIWKKHIGNSITTKDAWCAWPVKKQRRKPLLASVLNFDRSLSPLSTLPKETQAHKHDAMLGITAPWNSRQRAFAHTATHILFVSFASWHLRRCGCIRKSNAVQLCPKWRSVHMSTNYLRDRYPCMADKWVNVDNKHIPWQNKTWTRAHFGTFDVRDESRFVFEKPMMRAKSNVTSHVCSCQYPQPAILDCQWPLTDHTCSHHGREGGFSNGTLLPKLLNNILGTFRNERSCAPALSSGILVVGIRPRQTDKFSKLADTAKLQSKRCERPVRRNVSWGLQRDKCSKKSRNWQTQKNDRTKKTRPTENTWAKKHLFAYLNILDEILWQCVTISRGFLSWAIHAECVSVCEWLRTDGQDYGTENNCVSMCRVHCRVIVDNKSEFYHSSSHVDCTVWCQTRELINVEESNTSLYQHSSVLKKKRLLSPSSLRISGL